jgi:HAD superfamily hydrolase (TIGR01509 family)
MPPIVSTNRDHLPVDPIKALIFDLDGLLVDSEPLAGKAMAGFLSTFGKSTDPAIQSEMLGRRLPEAIAIARDGYQLPGQLEDLISTYDRMRLDALRGVVTPMKGAVEILKFAKDEDLSLALATSGMRRHADLSLAETGLAGYFEVEVTGDDVTHGKPAPDLFLLAAERLGITPSNCVVLEDSPLGIEAATAAGMRSIAVLGRASRQVVFHANPTALVDDLFGALEWLKHSGAIRFDLCRFADS